MINALQELSNAPDGKHLNSLSRTICSFLLSCYKDDGNLLPFSVLSLSCASTFNFFLGIYLNVFILSFSDSFSILLSFEYRVFIVLI